MLRCLSRCWLLYWLLAGWMNFGTGSNASDRMCLYANYFDATRHHRTTGTRTRAVQTLAVKLERPYEKEAQKLGFNFK